MKLPARLRKLANKFGFFDKGQMNSMVRDAVTGWQAAAINRLTQTWTTQNLSVDSDIRRELPTLRARSRQVFENNDYGKQFIRMLKNNVLGEYGIQLKSKAKEPVYATNAGQLDSYANRVIEEEWYKWGKKGYCTVDRRLSWCDFQALALETIARDGEVLIRKVRGFDNDHQYALQLIEADYLDIERNEILTGGNEIRMGVEFNVWREPVAYYLFRRHPNDNLYSDPNLLDRYERVPAYQIIHPFISFRPHQSRGVPWGATAINRMNMLGKYEEAEVVASRAAASKMAFLIPSLAGQEYKGDELTGGVSMDAEPGAIEQLPFGMDLKTLDWNHPNSSYHVFMKTCLRGACAGLGVSYNSLGNDMESVNFASGRLGLEQEREMFKSVQRWFTESVINEAFEDWLDVQLMNQKIRLPYSKFDKFNAADWRPRRWGFGVKPLDDINAKIQAVRAGFTSVSRVIAEAGGLDRDEIFEEIKADKEMANSMGIELPALLEGTSDAPDANPQQDDPPNEPGSGEPADTQDA